MQKHNKYFAEDAFNSSNLQLEIYPKSVIRS